MRGKWLLISASVILLGVAAGALSRLRRPPARPAAPQKIAPASATVSNISLPGKVQAEHVVNVDAKIGGVVESFYADAGQQVFEGQLLARITNPGLAAAHQQAQEAASAIQSRVTSLEGQVSAARLEASRARADAARARSEYDRVEKIYLRQQMLFQEGATPRLTYEKAQADFEKVKMETSGLEEMARQADERVQTLMRQLETAKKELDDKKGDLEATATNLAASEVHSPVDGIVISRRGEVGKETGPGVPDLFRIGVDLTELSVIVEPEPAVLRRIKPAQPALVSSLELGVEDLPGSVKEIKGNQVVVEFKNPHPELKPGMTVRVRIKL